MGTLANDHINIMSKNTIPYLIRYEIITSFSDPRKQRPVLCSSGGLESRNEGLS